MESAKSQGTTQSERYLAKLCEQTFLSLWSYPNVFRDQGRVGDGVGKEVCDLLVVCGRDVVIFSDKSCHFPATGNLKTDWTRWYKRTIKNSAKQLYGAQRWIREFPNRLYLDARCESPFPLNLPSATDCRFHLVVVALGAKARCRHAISGSGSLVLDPAITGDGHMGPESQPFLVGDVDPSRDFIHVLDDVTLDIILGELDTVTDFLGYLSRKEDFIRSGKLAIAEGEENLVAYYLSNMHEDKHDFLLPAPHTQLFVEDGHWQNFANRSEVIRKSEADNCSYLWDHIIEEFSRHTVHGTALPGSVTGIAEAEVGIRIMAAEPRVYRRMLAQALRDRVATTTQTQFSKRTVMSDHDPTLAYVFMALPGETDDEEKHRHFRREYLANYCFVLAWKHRQLRTVVGIATEAGVNVDSRSYDLVVIRPDEWTPDKEEEAKNIQVNLDILRDKNISVTQFHGEEYPSAPRIVLPKPQLVIPHASAGVALLANTARNSPCPCGSGKKYKRCCMRRLG